MVDLRLTSLCLATILLLASAPASARPRRAAANADPVGDATITRAKPTSMGRGMGFGLMLGEPTGIGLKSWTSTSTAYDAGLTYSFSGFIAILGDHLWHFPGMFASKGRLTSEFVPYIGAGVEVFFDTSSQEHKSRGPTARQSNASFAARVPLGIEFLPNGSRFGVFAEITPGLVLAPAVSAILESYVGMRFYL